MTEKTKDAILSDEPVEYAVLKYEKLQFYRVYPPSLPGDTAADCLRRAINSLLIMIQKM